LVKRKVRLNRLRIVIGLFGSIMHKWDLGALGELLLRSRGTNGWSHDSFLPPTPPFKRNTRCRGYRRWHCRVWSWFKEERLASYDI